MSHRGANIITGAVFGFVGITVAILIYFINDETQSLLGIFRPEYLIPTILYSGSVVGLCFFLYILLKRRINRFLSLAISIMFGIPIALHIVINLGRVLFF